MMQIESDLKLFLDVARETTIDVLFYVTVCLSYGLEKETLLYFFPSQSAETTTTQSTIQRWNSHGCSAENAGDFLSLVLMFFCIILHSLTL
jgi:hypothetical protein